MPSSLTAESYGVGIICALARERAAIEAMLDEKHSPLPTISGDNNIYTFGSIGRHNVIVASLGADAHGIVSTAGVAADMRRSYPHVKYRLMVGTAGAVPGKSKDIRLGDVVVGCALGLPSIINYDIGKDTDDDFDVRSELAGPPPLLARVVSALEAGRPQHGPAYLEHLSNMLRNNPRMNRPIIVEDYYNIPDKSDRLSGTDEGGISGHEAKSKRRQFGEPIKPLDPGDFVKINDDGTADYPWVFRGTIGSANRLIKNAASRDDIFERVKKQRKAEILCFDMASSGMVGDWQCLVIRGISNYCDASKNDEWQNFASATAAAYAKEVILHIPPEAVWNAKPVAESNRPAKLAEIPSLNESIDEKTAEDYPRLTLRQWTYQYEHQPKSN